MNKPLLLLLSFLAAVCAPVMGADNAHQVTIHFGQSKTVLDTAYMGNAGELRRVQTALDQYCAPDSGYILTEVYVEGAASPEGSVKINKWLSERRAESIFNHIGSMTELPDSITTYRFLGRDWARLLELAGNDPNVPYRAKTLSLLHQIASKSSELETGEERNLQRLKNLAGGVPYRYLYRKYFRELRASRLRLTFVKVPQPVVESEPEPVTEFVEVYEPADTIEEPVIYEVASCRPFYMDIHTNMLYDLLAVPNIGVEFYLGANLSVSANWMYGWWNSNAKHRYWRVYGGDLAVRWWLGSAAHRKPLTGHHLGVYGGALVYDFEWGGRGWMGGVPGGTLWDRANWHAGVEYGYSLPITRRLNIDFTLGLGYMGGQYREYTPQDGHYVWQSTHNRRWIGPTKAEISLVWLIGCGNTNIRKGGAE